MWLANSIMPQTGPLLNPCARLWPRKRQFSVGWKAGVFSAPCLHPTLRVGMRSPLGEPVRSECVAGMDMLNDMFQRQVIAC